MPEAKPMERSFKKEVDALRLGDGETFRGEGILERIHRMIVFGLAGIHANEGCRLQVGGGLSPIGSKRRVRLRLPLGVASSMVL